MATNRMRMLNVRILEAETELLAELAEREGVSISEWIRNVVRREHAIAFSSAVLPRKKPKKK